jgi:hypothetical protein
MRNFNRPWPWSLSAFLLTAGVGWFGLPQCRAAADPAPRCAHGLFSAADGPYTLKLKLNEGEETTYNVNLNLAVMSDNDDLVPNVDPTPLDFHAVQKVVKIAPEGCTFQWSVPEQSIVANGQTVHKAVKPVTAAVDADGRSPEWLVLRIQSAVRRPEASLINCQTTQIVFPPRAVAVGDTWTEPINLPTLNAKGETAYTLASAGAVGDTKTVRIHFRLHCRFSFMWSGQGPTTDPAKAAMVYSGEFGEEGDADVAIEDGRTVKETANIDLTLDAKPNSTGAADALGKAARAKITAQATFALAR